MDSGYDWSFTASSTTEYSRDSYAPSLLSNLSKDSCTQNGLSLLRDNFKGVSGEFSLTGNPSQQVSSVQNHPVYATMCRQFKFMMFLLMCTM